MQKEKRFQPMGNEKMLLRMAAHSNIPGHVFIRIFSHDPQVIHQGIISLRVINIFLPLIGFQAIGANTYQALGRGLAGFVLSLARQVLFFLPVVLFFKLMFGLNGIFLSFPVADLGASLVTALWLRHTFKQFNGKLK